MFSFISTTRTRILSTVGMDRVLLARNRPRTYLLSNEMILRRTLRLLIIRRVTLTETSIEMNRELISEREINFGPFTVLMPRSLLNGLTSVSF